MSERVGSGRPTPLLSDGRAHSETKAEIPRPRWRYCAILLQFIPSAAKRLITGASPISPATAACARGLRRAICRIRRLSAHHSRFRQARLLNISPGAGQK